MQKFIEIKRSLSGCINTLLDVINETCDSIERIYDGNPILKHDLPESKVYDLKRLGQDLEKNLVMITRTKMKCAFFGKTSNGKSAVINAMLGEDVLPSCCGRTTSCFITVTGCREQIGYFLDNFGTRLPISQLEDFASEYDENRYGMDSEIRLFWPISQCDLLEHDIELIDSPGCDVSVDNDSWITKYCLDADVFVYVVDSSSTLCQTERDFFGKVKRKIGNPNIFFLLNKWDLCRNNANEKLLRQQHIATIKSFLNDDAKNDSERKTFFLSATENLRDHTPEFERFVKALTWEMTQRAVVTKFKQHSDKGNDVIESVISLVDLILKFEKSNNCERTPVKDCINNWIEMKFKDIEQVSVNRIESNCQSFTSSLSTKIKNNVPTTDLINTFIKCHFTEIINNLKVSVENILPHIRECLENDANVHVDKTLMDMYMPHSFDELMSKYKKKLDKKIMKSGIMNAYNELDSYLRPSNSGEISRYTNIPIIDYGISLLWGIVNTVSTIVSTVSDSFSGRDRQAELENDLRNKINDLLTTTVKNIIKKIKNDIVDRISDMTDIFVMDCDEISKLIQTLKDTKNRLENLADDLLLEKIKIETIDQ